MATKGKTTTKTAKRRTPAGADMDRRWAILLFGLGLGLLALAFIPGESAWAWIRSNILFGTFGVAGWLLGPMLIWWAVLVSLEKPVFGPLIKSVIFIFVLCGVVLVFSPVNLEGLGFGEVLAALLENGRTAPLGGGLLSLVFGATLLLLTGQVAARVLIVLLLAIAVMLLTGVTPGDIVRFFGRIGDRVAARMYAEEEEGDEEEYQPQDEGAQRQAPPPLPAQPTARQPAMLAQQAVPPAAPTNTRMRVVDIALEQSGDAPLARRRNPVDVDLGPEGPVSEPGLDPNAPVEIGPGGTFGQNPLGGDTGLPGDFEPLVPFNPYSREKIPEGAGKILLFGEDDPYANLGGAESKLPRGTLLDVEYMPRPDPQFDLFGNPLPGANGGEGPQPPAAPYTARPTLPNGAAPLGAIEQPGALPFEGGQPVAPKGTVAFPEQGSAAAAQPAAQAQLPAEDEVDALIEKAAPKKEEDKAADTREQEHSTPQPYSYPPVTIFDAAPPEATAGVREEMRKTADLLVSTLSSFGVETRILDISRGPSVTRYEVQPQAGVKISRITNLSDDIALNLSAAGVRIEAPIPGKPAVGIEVPNKVKSTVSIRSILESNTFASATSPLSIALGKNIAGEVVVADLTKMPHLLIAGSTGSGKSVCVNSIIMSFLYKSAPEDVRLVLIDPKVVELAEYNGIPHLLIPVVTEPKMAAKALGQAVVEMEARYHLFAQHNVRDISSFNKVAARNDSLEHMPHIAIVIDELADLMMTAGKDVENYICRIAQKARAAGMHLIVATQRPSVDVITGLIKSNIPSRIAFAVSSQVDSRTILDGAGAEKLLGMGDMLFMPIGANKPVRVQGTYVKDREISKVLNYVKRNGGALYDDVFLAEMDKVQLSGAAGKSTDDDEEGTAGDIIRDAVFQNAVETVLEAGQASTSYLQRRLRLGYARAGRIMDQMERMGIISEPDGSKPRQVLISRQAWQEMLMNAED